MQAVKPHFSGAMCGFAFGEVPARAELRYKVIKMGVTLIK